LIDYLFQKLPKFGEKYFETAKFDLCLRLKGRKNIINNIKRTNRGDDRDGVEEATGEGPRDCLLALVAVPAFFLRSMLQLF